MITNTESIRKLAFTVDDYVVRSLDGPAKQLAFGDVVLVTFLRHNIHNSKIEEFRRLLLVLTVENKKSGNFEGLVLPCLHEDCVPDDRQTLSLTKQCAEKVESGKKIIPMLEELCIPAPPGFESDIPF